MQNLPQVTENVDKRRRRGRPRTQPTPTVEGLVVDRDTIAAVFGVTAGYVSQLCAQGMPREGHGQYDLAVCVQWRIAKAEAAADLAAENADNPDAKRLLRARADKTEMEVATMRRSLVPINELLHSAERMAQALVDTVDSLAARIAPAVAEMSNETQIREYVIEECRHARQTCATEIETLSHVD